MTRIIKAGLLAAAVCFPAGPLMLYFGGNWYSFFHSYSLGMQFGILAYGYFLLALMLSARFRFLDKLFGHDKVLLFHEAIAVTAFVCVLLHVVFKLMFSASITGQVIFGMAGFSIIAIILLGTFFYMTVGSAPPPRALAAIREKARRIAAMDYSVMKQLHNGGAFAMALIAVHVALAPATGESSARRAVMGGMAGAAVLVYFLHKFVRPVRLSSRGCTVADVSERAPGITSVVFRSRARHSFKPLPGHYIYLRVRAPAFSGEEHPFTIASADSRGGLMIFVKAVGDYTSRIGLLQPGSKVLIDGPYGTFRPRRWDRPLLFIAGGIGITPFFSLVASWEARPDKTDLTLLWSARTEVELFDKGRFEELQSREIRFSFFPVVTRGIPADEAPRRKVRMLAESVIDTKGVGELDVFLCGPQPMRRELFAALRKRGIARGQLHFERFS